MSETPAVGRPTKYKEEYNDLAYNYCLLGATDEKLAEFFDVDVSTINNWKTAHPEFFVSIKKGKQDADAMVAKSLFHRATGYHQPAVKIFNDQGEPLIVPYTERFPPDTTAAIFWLKNRQPAMWRDKQELDVNQKSEIKVSADMSPQDAAKAYQDLMND